MDAKLNDKNLAQLQDAKSGDVDLLMTTPSQLGVDGSHEDQHVKKEFPTLPLLEEAMKAAKKTYLAQAVPYIFSMRLPTPITSNSYQKKCDRHLTYQLQSEHLMHMFLIEDISLS